MPIENFSVLLGKLAEHSSSEFAQPAFRVSTQVAEVMLSLGAVFASAGRAAVYSEEAARAPAPAPLSLSDLKNEIARATSVAELRGLRRRFARCSHPDCYDASKNSMATYEMAVANRMIDEAISSMSHAR